MPELLTSEYDVGTGKEVFGFMPWGAREKVFNLAKGDATLHPLTVDGSPSVADVWIDSNADPYDGKQASEFRSLLPVVRIGVAVDPHIGDGRRPVDRQRMQRSVTLREIEHLLASAPGHESKDLFAGPDVVFARE